MTRTRYGLLTVLLAGLALMLAGCGGDDNGGISAADQARIAALEGDVETLEGDVETLEGDVETIEGDVETIEGDVETIEGDVDAAPDGVTAEEAVMATYEDLFTPVVEGQFSEMVGANPSIQTIVSAIRSLATRYDEADPNTLAGLEANLHVYFSGTAPTSKTALEYFQMLRAGGFLMATRERVIAMTGAYADMQATQDEIDDVWESVFTPAVEAQFTAMVGTNPSIQTIVGAIRALATQYNVTDPDALRGLEAATTSYFSLAPPTVLSALDYFRAWRDMGWLPATQARAAAVLVAQGGGAAPGPTPDPDPDPDPGPGPGPDPDPPAPMTPEEMIDAIVAAAGDAERNNAILDDDAPDYASGSLVLNEEDELGDATIADGIARSGFGGIEMATNFYGGWLKHNFFGILQDIDPDMTGNQMGTFSLGEYYGKRPMVGVWNGAMQGYLTTETAEASATNLFGGDGTAGDMRFITGLARITVSQTGDGNPTAMLDLMNVAGTAAADTNAAGETNPWGAMTITSKGAFSADDDAGDFSGSSVDGRFYGPDGSEAGGIFELTGAPSGTLFEGDTIVGAFGTTNE